MTSNVTSFAETSTSGDNKEDIEQLTKPSSSLQQESEYQQRSPTYSAATIDNNTKKG